MTRIHAGATLDRPPGPKYAAALDFAELAPPSPFPTERTLRRWRSELPEGLTLSWVVPATAARSSRGPLRFDDAMTDAFARAREAAQILGARFAVLSTGADVTTGPRDRALLTEWVARWGADAGQIVWQPTGLWEAERAIPFAAELGVLYAFDPLETDAVPVGEVVYARLRAIGTRTRFDESRLEEALEAIEETEAADAYVAIESATSFREASRLAQLAG
ncbi:MAG: hypothetical protein KF729_31230 [Sandaracinaceae bacterium]|nr:hypothetical protein [Sandaracinaceae bacterium]